MNKENKVRVVLTQGYCILRNTMIEQLEEQGWIEVCATATSADDVWDLVDQHRPHVLVTNISLKCLAGISSLKKIKREFFWLSIVAYSCDSEFDGTYANHVLQSGATAYVSCNDTVDDLVKAIWRARNGKQFVSKSALEKQAFIAQELYPLSDREAEVFCLTGCGYVTRRIAEKLSLEVKTIESYKERVRKKMGYDSSGDMLYAASSFMRAAARGGVSGSDDEVIRTLLSATG